MHTDGDETYETIQIKQQIQLDTVSKLADSKADLKCKLENTEYTLEKLSRQLTDQKDRHERELTHTHKRTKT